MIRRVRLVNFKSHQDTEIVFPERGLIAISGKNYAGKTSILQALGLALFNWKPAKLTEMIRRGSKKARIEVELQSKLDQEFYTVVREIRTSASWVILKEGQDEARGSEQARAWLRQHYKLKDETKLELLFSEAVGVPQGNFVKAFEMSGTQRKETFDPLLGLSEYRDAHRYLRDSVNGEIKEHLQRLDKEMAALQGQVHHYRPLKKRLQESRLEEKSLQTRLRRQEKEKKQWQQKVETLDQQSSTLEAVGKECREEEWRFQALEKERQQAEKAFFEAENARQQLAMHTEGYQHYTAARKRLLSIEDQLSEADTVGYKEDLNAAREQLLQRRALHQTTLEREEELKPARQEWKTILPQVEKQDRLEQQLRTLHQQQQHREALLRREQGLQERIDEAETWELQILADVEGFTADLALLENWQKQEHSLLRQKQEAEVRLKVFREHQRYQQTSPNLCPFLGSPCQNAAQGNFVLSERLTAQEQKVRMQLENAILPPLQRVQADLESLANVQHALTKARQQQMLVQRDLTHFRKELIAVLTDLQEAPCQKSALSSLQSALESLNNPRLRKEHLAAQLRQLESLQKRKQSLASGIQALEVEIAELEKGWLPLKALEEEAQAHRRQMSLFEQDFVQYSQKEAKAAQWNEWNQRLETLERNTSKQKKTWETLAARREKLQLAWDQTAHHQARRSLADVSADCASLAGSLQRLSEEIALQAKEVEELEQAREKLQQKEEEARLWRRRQKALSLVSRKIKDAGPEIADRIRLRISRSANSIYSSLVDSASEQIAFSNTYGIQIRDGQDTRAFETLAGSEQMSAAMAIRMGLLEETSELDFVFFDEPTTHLDSAHRDKLASQLNQLNIPQKFVISHDDSFEPYLTAIFEVSKVNGNSQVEAEYF
jgi:exonuclease SbcC